jgi:hypothetical protein
VKSGCWIRSIVESAGRGPNANTTVFLGYPDVAQDYIVFAIPNPDPDPIRLMDIFDVGSYNDNIGDTPERAKRYMAIRLSACGSPS